MWRELRGVTSASDIQVLAAKTAAAVVMLGYIETVDMIILNSP